MKFILLVSAMSLVACHSLKPAQTKQGLSGYVYRISGNQMPGPNRPARKPKGISCELYIYEPATLKQVEGNNPLFTKINTKLVAITRSDSTGHYAMNLPAGKYSVFIKDHDQFFASESDGDGVLNPVEIVVGKITARDWKLTSGAVY